ncbi:MAG TPA: signal peptidase II [Thermoanaerobaculia bacterium]|jgi:signal peptidase II
MKGPLRSGLLALALISCVGCDQAAKALARGTLASSPPVALLGGAVHLQYAENPGAFLSLGASLPPAARFLLWVVFVAATLAALLVFTFRAAGLSWGQRAGLALILSGGLGNLIDRVVNDGQVIDFVVLRLGPLHTGIFNVADVAITAGILVFLLSWREAITPPASPSPAQTPSAPPAP